MADDVARYRPGDRLLTLVERAGVASGRLSLMSAEAAIAAQPDAVRHQARLSAMLDGSPLREETADNVDQAAAGGLAPPESTPEPAPDALPDAAGGWSAALRIDRLPTQDVAAREYANLLACAEVESEVAGSFFDRPLHAMTKLHVVICAGLVAADMAARFRQTERAIHDGAQGQILWAAPRPDRIPAMMDGLLDWLGGQSADRPALVVAAIAHERILEWQPFEAANGRLARSVARVIRRARGLDPFGLAVPERYWQSQTMAYHREVAATMRRRGDLTRWIDRIAHSETVALEAVVDSMAALPVEQPPPDLTELLASVGAGATLTIPETAAHLGVSRERARADLALARRAGLVEDDLTVPAARFRVVDPALARTDGGTRHLSNGAG